MLYLIITVTTKLINYYVMFFYTRTEHIYVIRQCMETHRLHASARWLLLEKQPGPFLQLSRHFKSVAKHAAAVKVYRPFDTVNFVAKCG